MSFRYKILYKSIIVLSIAILVLPSFLSASSGQVSFAQTADSKTAAGLVTIPENFEEAKGFIMQIVKSLPNALRGSGEEAKEIWQKTWVKWWNNDIYPWLDTTWRQNIKPFADKIIEKVKILLGKEIEKREPIIKEEFKKEKEEMKKEELPKVSKSLFKMLKELLSDI